MASWLWEIDTVCQAQILDKADCISIYANALEKGIHLSLLPLAMSR